MSGDLDDYEIGYGKPPAWSRFRKGLSGNPKGRPRKRKPEPTPVSDSPLDDILRAELDREIKVTDAGKPRKMTMREVITRSQITQAAKGNVHAQREVIRQTRELEARDTERAKQAAEQARRDAELDELVFKRMVAEKAERTRIWEEAATLGGEPEKPWPHPDDILLDHENRRWRVRGPSRREDIPLYEYCRAMRDQLLVQTAILRRSRQRSQRCMADLFDALWIVFDVMLPQRWQAMPKLEVVTFWFEVMPLRELREAKRRYAQKADMLHPLVTSREHDKEAYRFANSIMKPLLQRGGYRSLAEFERACEDTYGDPPWPKLATDGTSLVKS